MKSNTVVIVPIVGFLLALLMNFWHLGQPSQLISDEWYFVQDARHYLTHTPYVDAHPPLGKMQIGMMMKLFGDTPTVWRLVNAVEGALLVPLVWWIAWLLTKKTRVAALAMVFALFDGLRITDSRSGLINIPYVFYSLGAVACLLKARISQHLRWWLLAAGLLSGLAISVKWLAVLVIIPATIWWIWPKVFPSTAVKENRGPIWLNVVCLFLVPIITYLTIFFVHFAWLHQPTRIIDTNILMIHHHTHGKTGHLYQQDWWGWPTLQQPFLYWTETTTDGQSYIWNMPHPIVWWSGWAVLLFGLLKKWPDRHWRWLMVFLLCSWLPFAFIRRDMFMYHAPPFSLMLGILLAVFLEAMWQKSKKIVLGYLTIVILGFVFFAPWFLNIPLSRDQQHWRQWMPGWTIKA